MTELVLPVHANHMQTMFGGNRQSKYTFNWLFFSGQTMEWMKACASIAATRFARKPAIVKSIDDIYFFCPIKVGDRIVIKSQVKRKPFFSGLKILFKSFVG
jgi:acyl-CoA hydrolase